MVHQYKNNGYNIVMDVCSGAVHVVDDVTYDVIEHFEEWNLDQMVGALPWPDDEIREAYEEAAALRDEGLLFTEDVYEDYIKEIKSRETVVKALCLHIAHDCNLACRYCFAEEGEYKGGRALMSAEVGRAALQQATLDACVAPMDMLQSCAELVPALETIRRYGAKSLQSDVGCAASALAAALECAGMNLLVNTRLLDDGMVMEHQLFQLLDSAVPRAKSITRNVMDELRR